MFPEWTDREKGEGDAVQHLRLNELRDAINQILFPYLTTITPYARMASWILWVLVQVHSEIGERMPYSEYREKYLRYYSVLAAADTIHAMSSASEHRGPIGVELLARSIGSLPEDADVDFRVSPFSRPADPVPQYVSSLSNMGLAERKLQPTSSGASLPLLVPVKMGERLASCLEEAMKERIDPRRIVHDYVWSREDLLALGEAICLQGLSSSDEESLILEEAVRRSLRNPRYYDDLLSISQEVGKKAGDSGFTTADVGRACLYGRIRMGSSYVPVNVVPGPTRSLLAFHELHTHCAYGADSVLAGIVQMSKPHGVAQNRIVKLACSELGDSSIKIGSMPIRGLLLRLEKSSSQGGAQKNPSSLPAPGDPFGFETIQDLIQQSESNAALVTGLGSFILLQSAWAYSLFDTSWISDLIPRHRDVFGAFQFAELLESMGDESIFKDWLGETIDIVVQQHSDVAISKGEYARRIEKVGPMIYYRAEAGNDLIRGRLPNALAWLSDLGHFSREGGVHRLCGV